MNFTLGDAIYGSIKENSLNKFNVKTWIVILLIIMIICTFFIMILKFLNFVSTSFLLMCEILLLASILLPVKVVVRLLRWAWVDYIVKLFNLLNNFHRGKKNSLVKMWDSQFDHNEEYSLLNEDEDLNNAKSEIMSNNKARSQKLKKPYNEDCHWV
ncbi:glycoprotein [Yerba mate virus A]|uniref:Glycoprotein n=1 Tax=Yerba mate virus A TaxID=2713499 RepID=A0A6G6CIS4_9RHAB|nr:glycoprotein [Yerba mate virus A]QID92310.1 glycoprotein [Yerba mate virus A]